MKSSQLFSKELRWFATSRICERTVRTNFNVTKNEILRTLIIIYSYFLSICYATFNAMIIDHLKHTSFGNLNQIMACEPIC